MLSFTLDCGRRVTLDAFDYARTYSGLLEGLPTPAINARIIEHALSERDGTWGRRRTHLIPPAVDDSDPDHPLLPPACLRAWLWCNDPIDPAFMGSSLVVVWFAEDCFGESIARVVLRDLRGLPWERIAEDFDW
ncbi:hypothetical protein OJF2_39240 [Aquisphaera giovannonii]|uniref:Uncharacterized protein n=1 Tax=Aquisphaera giovannonii TaxID=406548 RepID=A0A5B9W448_9BACT|nr:hypothetical protein [Aquisphaera giovannonii]QEH35372.1 hypothetical protein OJF2_39240 [Aquisphaera giovannonii]